MVDRYATFIVVRVRRADSSSITSQTATTGTAIRAPRLVEPIRAPRHQVPTIQEVPKADNTAAVRRVTRATRHPHLDSNTVRDRDRVRAMEAMGRNSTPRSHNMDNSTDRVRVRVRVSMATARRLDSVDSRDTEDLLPATVKDHQQGDHQVATGNKVCD